MSRARDVEGGVWTGSGGGRGVEGRDVEGGTWKEGRRDVECRDFDQTWGRKGRGQAGAGASVQANVEAGHGRS